MDGQQQTPTGGKYRKKPVVIDAITFDELVEHGKRECERTGGALVRGMPWSFTYNGHAITHENDRCYLIPTLEGVHNFTPADMLITGVKGEIYPCKLDIFGATYEPAGEESAEQAPDASIGITWTGQGFTINVKRNTDLSQPAAHLAEWLQRNLQPLAMMAAVDWNVKREHEEQVRQILQAAAGQGEQAAEDAQEKAASDEPRLQLVSSSGGLVQ